MMLAGSGFLACALVLLLSNLQSGDCANAVEEAEIHPGKFNFCEHSTYTNKFLF